MTRCCKSIIFLPCIFTVLAISVKAQTSWDDPSGGDFLDDVNWTNDAPTASVPAIFDLDNQYTVFFTGNAASETLDIDHGDITFDIHFDGTDYTYNSGRIFMGNDGNDVDFRLERGALISSGGGSSWIGDGSVTVNATVTGANTVWTIDDLRLADGSSTATFNVQSGATLNLTDGANLSWSPNTTAIINVDGVGSELNVTGGSLIVGRREDARIFLSDQASLTSAAALQIAAAREGLVEVDNSTITTQSLYVGRESVAAPAEGVLRIQNGSVVDVDAFVRVAQQNNNRRGDTTGLIVVDDSTLNIGTSILMGERSNPGDEGYEDRSNFGTVQVINGGIINSALSSSAALTIGFGDTGQGGRGVGLVEIIGENSVWTHGATTGGNVILGGGGSEDLGLGTLDIRDQGHMQTHNNVTVNPGSEIRIASGTLGADNLAFLSGAIFQLTLASTDTTPRIQLSGEFDPGQATFDLLLAGGFSADIDDVFPVVMFDDWSSEIFDGLPEGSILFANGYEFRVSYGADLEDHFTLTVIPEPSMLALLGMASGFLALLRRRRR